MIIFARGSDHSRVPLSGFLSFFHSDFVFIAEDSGLPQLWSRSSTIMWEKSDNLDAAAAHRFAAYIFIEDAAHRHGPGFSKNIRDAPQIRAARSLDDCFSPSSASTHSHKALGRSLSGRSRVMRQSMQLAGSIEEELRRPFASVQEEKLSDSFVDPRWLESLVSHCYECADCRCCDE